MRKSTTMRKAAAGGALLTALSPLTVLGLVGPAAAETTTTAQNKHDFTVVKLVGRGDYAVSDAEILGRLHEAIDFWQAETGAAATFEVPTSMTELSSTSSCNSSDVRKEAAALFPGVKFGTSGGHHLVVLMPSSCRTVSANGLVGPGLYSGGWLNASVGADTSDLDVTFVHELGHNLGLLHANGVACTPDAGCAVREYFNRYSSMGVSMTGRNYAPAPLDSYERTRMGIAGDGEIRALSLEAGRRAHTFDVTLRGRGTASGLRGVRVVDPVDGTTYYLDFHNGAGREAQGYAARTWTRTSGTYFNRGVSVEHVEPSAGGTPYSVLQRAADDGTLTRYALIAQDSYTSIAGGIRVTVTGMDSGGLETDTARLRVVLTNPGAPLGQQSGTIAITEQAAVGSTITATTAGWEDADLGDVQWYDGAVAIPGATGATFTVPAGSDGQSITARVTGTREGFADLAATSNAVVVGQDLLADGAVYAIGAADGLVGVPGATTSGGAQVVLQPGGVAGVNERWTARANPDGSYRLVNLATGFCLDNTASSSDDGSPTIEWWCHGGPNQDWRLRGSGAGFTLENVDSGKPTAAGEDAKLSQQPSGTVFTFTRLS